MKIKILIYFILPTILFGCNSISKEKQNNAQEFNDKLFNASKPVINEMNILFNLTTPLMNSSIQGTLKDADIENFQNQYDITVDKIEKNIVFVNSLDEFDKEINYKEAAVHFLNNCKVTMNDDYYELFVAIQNEMTQENIIRCGEIVIEIWGRLINLEKEIRNIQKQFAKKYRFELKKDPQNWDEIEKNYIIYKERFEKAKSQ